MKKYEIIGKKVTENRILHFLKDIPGTNIKKGHSRIIHGPVKLSHLGTCWGYLEGHVFFGDADPNENGWGGKCLGVLSCDVHRKSPGNPLDTRICKDLTFASKLARFVRS